jgi:hypothetical protein
VIVNTGVNDVSYARLSDIRDGDRRNLLYRNTLDRLRAEEKRGGPDLWTRIQHRFYMARVPGWLVTELRRSLQRRLVGDLRPPEPGWDLLDHFERNLKRLSELVVGTDSATVYFSTPPSSLLTLYEADQPPLAHYWVIDARTTQAYRDSLDARMRSVVDEGVERGLPLRYVPHETFPPSLFLDDAHLTSKGNRRVALDFVGALEPLLAGGRGR